MKLIPKIPLRDYYHIPSKTWVAVISKKETEAYVSGEDNIIKKVSLSDLRSYPEYIAQFQKNKRVFTNN